MRVVGVDIGGTNVQVGLFDEMGEVYRVLEYETNQARGGQYMIKQLIEKITTLGPVDAIGVSVAGQVERDSGILIDAVNISNTNQLPIKAILQHHFHVPVIIENSSIRRASLWKKVGGLSLCLIWDGDWCGYYSSTNVIYR